jgi:hypothetical protein
MGNKLDIIVSGGIKNAVDALRTYDRQQRTGIGQQKNSTLFRGVTSKP